MYLEAEYAFKCEYLLCTLRLRMPSNVSIFFVLIRFNMLLNVSILFVLIRLSMRLNFSIFFVLIRCCVLLNVSTGRERLVRTWLIQSST